MEIFNAISRHDTKATQATSSASMNPKRMVEQSGEAQKKQNVNTREANVKLDNTVKQLNNHMQSLDTNVTFGFNDKINTMFVDVMEKSTGKLIRRIPTEEAMNLSEKMKEIVGMIFDKKG